jgi:hypothetical protein
MDKTRIWYLLHGADGIAIDSIVHLFKTVIGMPKGRMNELTIRSYSSCLLEDSCCCAKNAVCLNINSFLAPERIIGPSILPLETNSFSVSL